MQPNPQRPVISGALLVLWYLAVIVFAGHGLGPVGMFLVLGRAAEYVFPVVAGWVGLAAVAVALAVGPRAAGRWLAMLAAALLLASWVGFMAISQGRGATLFTSLPFLFMAAWWVYRNSRLTRVGIN